MKFKLFFILIISFLLLLGCTEVLDDEVENDLIDDFKDLDESSQLPMISFEEGVEELNKLNSEYGFPSISVNIFEEDISSYSLDDIREYSIKLREFDNDLIRFTSTDDKLALERLVSLYAARVGVLESINSSTIDFGMVMSDDFEMLDQCENDTLEFDAEVSSVTFFINNFIMGLNSFRNDFSSYSDRVGLTKENYYSLAPDFVFFYLEEENLISNICESALNASKSEEKIGILMQEENLCQNFYEIENSINEMVISIDYLIGFGDKIIEIEEKYGKIVDTEITQSIFQMIIARETLLESKEQLRKECFG